VNLSESIAITQNFVPPAHLQSVLRFLGEKNHQISGFADGIRPYELFREKLKEQYPDLLAKAEEEMTRASSKKRKWVEEPQYVEFTFDFFG
jgi:hypothetical protein